MIKAVFPGSFDPVTNGHINIIERASKIVDRLTVLVVYNSAKKTLFSFEERVSHLNYLTGGFVNVDVAAWNGLTVEYALKENAFIIRGVRNGSDYDYESQIAEINKKISGVETIFLPSAPEFSYLSSSVVKEIFSYGGNLEQMIDAYIRDRLLEKI